MPATGPSLARIAAEAGALIMRRYRAGPVTPELKADSSPVTQADREAEAHILAALGRDFPGVPVVAEEAQAQAETMGAAVEPSAHFFLVDPLDGTREYLARNGEFTVNIAEVIDGAPVAGAIYAPALGRLFYGDEKGAFEAPIEDGAAFDASAACAIQARRAPENGLTALHSRSHDDAATQEFLQACPIAARRAIGSSLKFCLLAAGEADIYARGGRTMEWDTAAGHAILSAAGGSVTGWDGDAFVYGKPGFENPGFVARGKI